MSRTRPSLDDYFLHARSETVEHNGSTLDLLAEYGARAQRRRKRRAAVVVTLTLGLTGVIGFEMIVPPSTGPEHPAPAVALHPEAAPPAVALRKGPSAVPEVSRFSAADSPVGRNARSSSPAPAAQQRTPVHRPAGGAYAHAETAAPAASHSAAPHPADPVPPIIHADLAAVDNGTTFSRLSDSPAQFVRPVVPAPAVALFDDAPPTEQRTVALSVGVHYGAAAADLSEINTHLAALDLPALESHFRSMTLRAGVATGGTTIGVEYTQPYEATASGSLTADPSIPLSEYADPVSLSTTYGAERWSVFAEYGVELTDNLSLDAGAQISLTSYELAFRRSDGFATTDGLGSNGKTPGSGTDEESGLNDWTRLWEQMDRQFEAVPVNQPATGGGGEAISSRTIGISPSIGLSWRALSSVGLHCRVRYLFNLGHHWENSATGKAVTGMEQLRLNEYSISIGASFYQWLF